MCLTLICENAATRSLILDIRNLCIEFQRFAGAARVLDGVSMSVYSGEKVGVVGETGCGKSLTMRAVMGLLPARRAEVTGGEILYMGHNLLKMDRFTRRRTTGKNLAMIFQDPMSSLNPVFTIGKQLKDVIGWSPELASRARFRFNLPRHVAVDATETCIDILSQVGLADPERIMSSYPFQLSGGMRQRVLIAMALANKPQLLIADEPGTALDVTTQAQVLKLLDNLVRAKDIAVVMITHNLGVVRETTDRVYVMYAGTVVESGLTHELFRDPRHPYTKGLLASVPRLSGLALSDGIDGSVPDYLSALPACRFADRCHRAEDKCHSKKPNLAEVGAGHFVACHML